MFIWLNQGAYWNWFKLSWRLEFHESYRQKQHVGYKLRNLYLGLLRTLKTWIKYTVSPKLYNLDEWLLQTEWSWNICFAKHLNKSILVRATSSCMHHNGAKQFIESHYNSYNLTSFILNHICTCHLFVSNLVFNHM